jgi:hypothetical protein
MIKGLWTISWSIIWYHGVPRFQGPAMQHSESVCLPNFKTPIKWRHSGWQGMILVAWLPLLQWLASSCLAAYSHDAQVDDRDSRGWCFKFNGHCNVFYIRGICQWYYTIWICPGPGGNQIMMSCVSTGYSSWHLDLAAQWSKTLGKPSGLPVQPGCATE